MGEGREAAMKKNAFGPERIIRKLREAEILPS
jgi:hypothetical protein